MENENNYNLNFGQAIDLMKKGCKVAREGWNGKGMFIYISGGYEGSKALKTEAIWNEHAKQVSIDNGGKCDFPPYIAMKTADNKIQCGWLANQADMLSEDWVIVE